MIDLGLIKAKVAIPLLNMDVLVWCNESHFNFLSRKKSSIISIFQM